MSEKSANLHQKSFFFHFFSAKNHILAKNYFFRERPLVSRRIPPFHGKFAKKWWNIFCVDFCFIVQLEILVQKNLGWSTNGFLPNTKYWAKTKNEETTTLSQQKVKI